MSKNVSFAEAFDLINKSQNIAVTAHINPDGDSVGSSLAIYHALKNMNKSVQIYMKDPVPKNFLFLPSAELIQGKPNQKLKFDLLILLDAKINRTGGVCEMIDAPILNMDHHISNDQKADFLILDAGSASCCEIIFQLFQKTNIAITNDVASCLYTGVVSDTGFFKFNNTTEQTFEVASKLIKAGANSFEIAEKMSSRDFEDILMLGKALQSTQKFFNDNVAGVFLEEEFANFAFTEDLLNLIRFTEGADIAFIVKYEQENVYRLRMRSHQADVRKITAKLNGGGHIHAAGATLNGTFPEIKSLILKTIEENYISN